MTGVAYIQSWMMKLLKKVKSRYLAVMAESHRPTPKLSAAICSRMSGSQTIAKETPNVAPAPVKILKYAQVHRNVASWSAKAMQFEMTAASGTIRRGK